MKLAITGAGGFLGSAAVEYFLKKDDVSEVRALYSRPIVTNFSSSKCVPLVGELSQAAITDRLIKGADCVLHLANRGYPLDKVENPAGVIEENVNATKSLVDSMLRHGVERILFSSSGGALYAPTPAEAPLKEDAMTVSRSAYAIFKLAIENILLEHYRAGSLKPSILRISNPYGVGLLQRERQGLIGVAVRKILKHETLEIWGSDQIRKDFIYIDDVLSAFSTLALKNNFPGEVFHVSSGVATSIREVIEALERISGRKLSVRLVEGKPADAMWTALDSGKLQAETGWRPRFNLEDGLTALWSNLR